MSFVKFDLFGHERLESRVHATLERLAGEQVHAHYAPFDAEQMLSHRRLINSAARVLRLSLACLTCQPQSRRDINYSAWHSTAVHEQLRQLACLLERAQLSQVDEYQLQGNRRCLLARHQQVIAVHCLVTTFDMSSNATQRIRNEENAIFFCVC